MSPVRLGLVVSGLVLALVVGTVAVHAQQAPAPKPAPAAPAPQAAAPKPAAAGAEKSLRDVMNGMKTNLKTLSAACTSKSKDPALAAVSEMERLILAAKAFEPQNQADTPEADRPQHLVDFRKELLRTLKELADLETDVLDGNFDAATKRIEGSLMDLRDESHDQFKKKRAPGGGR